MLKNGFLSAVVIPGLIGNPVFSITSWIPAEFILSDSKGGDDIIDGKALGSSKGSLKAPLPNSMRKRMRFGS